MEIVRRLQEAIPTIGKRKEFPRTLTETDLIADTAVVTGKYNLLGTGYTIPAQQEYWVGQGGGNEPMNQGYIYVYLKVDGGTEATGKVRIAVYTANDELKGIIYEEEEEILHGDLADRNKKQALPVDRSIKAGKDDYIAVLFKPDSAVTITVSDSIILLPVTNRWVPT